MAGKRITMHVAKCSELIECVVFGGESWNKKYPPLMAHKIYIYSYINIVHSYVK